MHFLDITSDGKLVIKLFNKQILLEDIIDEILEQNKSLEHVPSFTLRIQQLIGYQVTNLIESFERTIKKYDYPGCYQPLYPIKVNPRVEVLTTIMDANATYGLEAGTKSELILILTEIFDEQNFDLIIMCNGLRTLSTLILLTMLLMMVIV